MEAKGDHAHEWKDQTQTTATLTPATLTRYLGKGKSNSQQPRVQSRMFNWDAVRSLISRVIAELRTSVDRLMLRNIMESESMLGRSTILVVSWGKGAELFWAIWAIFCMQKRARGRCPPSNHFRRS